jgi:hypothetical protein
MNSKPHRPVQPRFDGFKALAGEKLLQWLAQTAEDAMGLSYELSRLRSQNTTTGDIE